MLKKLAILTSATVLIANITYAEGLRRSGQAGWDVYHGRLGLKIGNNASAIFGDEEHCSRNYVRNMVYDHYSGNINVEFVGSMSDLIGRIRGNWGGNGDSDGIILADVFDCGVSLGGRLAGAVCATLDTMQPMGTRYCAFGTQE